MKKVQKAKILYFISMITMHDYRFNYWLHDTSENGKNLREKMASRLLLEKQNKKNIEATT